MIVERTGVAVRWAEAEDAAVLTDVCREAWHEAYTGIIPPRVLSCYLDRRDNDWWSRACGRASKPMVLTVADGVVGYAMFGPSRDRHARVGEIHEMYLTPVCQGIGLGGFLFQSIRDALDRQGFREHRVRALAENHRARTFFWSLGGRPVRRARENFETTVLDVICFRFA